MCAACALVIAARDVFSARIGSRLVPNPTAPENLYACGIRRPEFLCDLDGVLGPFGARRVAAVLNDANTNVRIRDARGKCDGARPNVAVAVVHSAGELVFSEAGAVAGARSMLDRWGVAASPECRNGVAIALATNDRRVGFATGRHALRWVTDDDARAIIRDMKPYLRARRYAAALALAVARVGDEFSSAPAVGPVLRDAEVTCLLVCGMLFAWVFVDASRAWSHDAKGRRIERLLRMRGSTAADGAAADAADGPRCAVCLDLTTESATAPLPCGHRVCHACRWRFVGVAALADDTDARCPVCGHARARARARPRDLWAKQARRALPGGSDVPSWADESAFALRMQSWRGAAPRGGIAGMIAGRLTRKLATRAVDDRLARDARPAANGGGGGVCAFVRSREWCSDATRALLEREPDLLDAPRVPAQPGPPLPRGIHRLRLEADGQSIETWTPAQVEAAREGQRKWRDVRESARGWDGLPAAATFGVDGSASGTDCSSGGGGVGGSW